jgi:hypothetical protein
MSDSDCTPESLPEAVPAPLTERQLQALSDRYSPVQPPPCPECGGEIRLVDTGAPWRGRGAVYACLSGSYQWHAPLNMGDSQVLALVAEVRRLREQPRVIWCVDEAAQLLGRGEPPDEATLRELFALMQAGRSASVTLPPEDQ